MERKSAAFEDSLTKYLKAKKLYRLTDSDKEPCASCFGVGAGEAAKIKERVERELAREA